MGKGVGTQKNHPTLILNSFDALVTKENPARPQTKKIIQWIKSKQRARNTIRHRPQTNRRIFRPSLLRSSLVHHPQNNFRYEQNILKYTQNDILVTHAVTRNSVPGPSSRPPPAHLPSGWPLPHERAILRTGAQTKINKNHSKFQSQKQNTGKRHVSGGQNL